MKKYIFAAFLMVVLSACFVTPVFAANGWDDVATGNVYMVTPTPSASIARGRVESAAALAAVVNTIMNSSNPMVTYDYGPYLPSYELEVRHYSDTYGYAIYCKNKDYSGWVCTGNKNVGWYLVHCPDAYFDPDLLNVINGNIDGVEGLLRTIGDNTDTLETKLTNIYNRLAFNDLSVAAWCSQIQGNTKSIATKLDDMYKRLAYTVDGTTYSIANRMYWANEHLKAIDTNLVSNGITVSGWARRTKEAVDGVSSLLETTNYRLISNDVTLAGWTRRTKESVDTLSTYLSSNSYNVAHWSRVTYERLSTTNSRLSDVITAINNLTIGFDASDIKLNVDPNSLVQINDLSSYCCLSLSSEQLGDYPIMSLPYDTVTDIIARLNTDYIDKPIQIVKGDRTISTVKAHVLSAELNSSGYIWVHLSNGYGYYLCDSTLRVIRVDSSSNYGSGIVTALAGIREKLDNLSFGGDSTYDDTTLLNRLDTIIANQQNDIGLTSCNHQYVSEVSQEPTCALPGLMIYTCDLCGASYSEIMEALGHDWLCVNHVEPVFDEEGNVLSSGYDEYVCQICDRSYYDYDGTGAPDIESGSTITDLISRVFSKLGSFVGGVISSIINMMDKLLTGFDQIVTDFNERTNQILDFGGAYPAWLGGVWEIIPQEMQLALGFCIVVMALGIIGKKVVFS